MTDNALIDSEFIRELPLTADDPRPREGLSGYALCLIEQAGDRPRLHAIIQPDEPYPWGGLAGDARWRLFAVSLDPQAQAIFFALPPEQRETLQADALRVELEVGAADAGKVALSAARGEAVLEQVQTLIRQQIGAITPLLDVAALLETRPISAVLRRTGLEIGSLRAEREFLATAAEPPPLEPPLPQPPPPSEPDTAPPVAVPLRLDAAVPSTVFLNRSFTLAVALREVQQPVLDEAGLSQTASGDVLLVWPEDTPSVLIRVEVSTADCRIEGDDSQSFRLFHGQSSSPRYFQLVPLRTDKLDIFVTVFQEDESLGAARLVTTCVEAQGRAAGSTAITVNSLPLDVRPPAEWPRERVVAFRDALLSTFDIDELKDVCFRLDIDYDDLGGETKSAKARELIEFTLRHGRFAELVDLCRQLRPGAFP